MKTGEEYKNFVVISCDELTDFNAKGVYLRHKTTGLEVYHIINDDEENLFSFSFRTLAKNNYGAAHIMEHSVLCGSEKFPLKEPFTTLENQSVKTYLNAMTYPDKTCYPAASLIKSDYFNLMDVYADAVFFPKLSKQTFMQEGWRVEIDKENKLSIQGVVYNEMKGNFSSFNQIAINHVIDTMYPDSVFCYESGGDPLEIPSLSYENWLEFHKKFYSPENCLLFLYGNIPTEEQLDFIDEKYIPRLEKAWNKPLPQNRNSKTPFISDELRQLQKCGFLEKNGQFEYIAPDNGASGSMVCKAWYTGKADIETVFLSEVISGNDSSPLSKMLLESELGDDLAPVCGNFGYVYDNSFISYGLSGVKKSNEKKVLDFIQKSIQKIYEEGISSRDIDSAIMGIDFNLREKVRSWGPFSMVLMSKVLSAWSNGYEPCTKLFPISDFEKIKSKIKDNPEYVRSLLKKYFLDKNICADIIVRPSKKYFKERNKVEAECIERFEKSADKEKLRKELDELHLYQSREETQEELKCIPHLRIDQLSTDINHIKTEEQEIKGVDGSIPVILNREDTNGIVYVDAAFPIDNEKPEDFKYLPLMIDSLTELGWNGKKWDVCMADMACTMGDLGVRTIIGDLPDSEYTKASVAGYKNKNVPGRSWISISAKFLTSKIKESLDLLAEIITTIDFDDVKKLEQILSETQLDKASNFIRSGNHYLSLRGRCTNNRASAMSEIFYGLTQYFNVRSYTKKSVPELLKKYRQLYKEITGQGAVLHVTSDSESVNKVMELLPEFAHKADLHTLKPSKAFKHEEYLKQIYKLDEQEYKTALCIKIKTQAGYAASYFPCSIWLTKEAAAEDILSTWLNGHQLWEKIRMTGGAYGGSCAPDSTDKVFAMQSWRDPTPLKTLQLFTESLEEVCRKKFTREEIDCCIISNYSDEIVPDSPSQRGSRGFNRYLFGTTPEMIQKRIEDSLKVTPEDVHQAAVRLLNNSRKSKKLVICDNSTDFCGKVIQIKL